MAHLLPADLVYYLTSGICLGAVYALIALGYTMVYGIIKLINFAHGEFFMVGAYAGLGLYALLPGDFPVGAVIPLVLLASGLAGAAIAGLTEAVAYRPIRNSGRLSALLTAMGVSLLLQNLAKFIRNGNDMTYGETVMRFCQQRVPVGSGGIEAIRFAYIPVSLVLTGALWYLVARTRFGKAMRATSQDPGAAVLMGIDTDRVIRGTFLIGGFMAGIAGTLTGLTRLVEPMMGFMPGLNAFVAAVVGGIGSIPGAVVGGYVIGIVQFMVVYAGVHTEYKDVATLAVLIVVLVVRPQGILGRPLREKV
jgi:branched-chain amino acid transport system permease protein